MPFVLFAAVHFLSPKYFLEVETSAVLAPALAYGFVSLLVANYVMFRMVNFKV
jgi:Flp pilus assembly protein TadB